MKKLLSLGFIILIVIGLLLLPLAIIWAWNVLFPIVAIPYTFETWLAVGTLGIFFNSPSARRK